MCVRVVERAQRLFSLAQERGQADGGRGWGETASRGEQVEWERGKEGKQVMLGSPGRVSGQPEAAAGSWYLRPLSSSSSSCCSLQSGVPAGRQRTGSTGL